MMVVHLISPDGTLDQQYISNYATINIKDVLTRVDGVGDTVVFGARDYSMRVWLDPAKVQSRGLTAERRRHGVACRQRPGRGRRHQPAAGDIAGRLPGRGADARPADEPGAVQDIIVATDAGRPGHARARHRARRARRARLHDERLSRRQGRDRDRIFQRPGSNALATAAGVLATMDELAKSFPAGPELPHRLQHHRVHPAIGRRGDQDAVRSGRAGRARHHPVPADLARRDHSRSSPSRCR